MDGLKLLAMMYHSVLYHALPEQMQILNVEFDKHLKRAGLHEKIRSVFYSYLGELSTLPSQFLVNETCLDRFNKFFPVKEENIL